jgi:hypothetical protein
VLQQYEAASADDEELGEYAEEGELPAEEPEEEY